jgi:hypothetical protein
MLVSVKTRVAAASGLAILVTVMLGTTAGPASTVVASNPPPVPWVLKGPQPSPWVLRT